MAKLTTISITVEQREALRALAEAEGGLATHELVERLIRHERRRQMGAMLAATNAAMTDDERVLADAIVESGRRSVADALG